MSVLKLLRPNVLYFDLVGTLIRGAKPIGQQYAEHAERFGARPDAARLDTAFHHAMAAAPPMVFPGRSFDETAGLERLWWRSVVGEIVAQAGLSGPLAGETFERFFSSLYTHFTTAAAWELYPDVLPTLGRLRRGGVSLGLITNYDSRVFGVLDALGLTSMLSAVVVPAHVGAAKPDRAIFARALERLGVAPGDALHVGDEVNDDYRGAEAAGMRAVLLDRSGRFRGEQGLRRIESLAELV